VCFAGQAINWSAFARVVVKIGGHQSDECVDRWDIDWCIGVIMSYCEHCVVVVVVVVVDC